jgi:hypothetical protein
MASLGYRRGGWELYYRDPAGRQRVERFPGAPGRKPPAEAAERLAAVERQLRWREYVDPEQRATTFREYYDRWAASRQVSKTKRHTDDGRAKLHVLPYWGGWSGGDIRPTDIDDWIARLSKRMGPWSVRHCYALLRGPLRRAVKDRVITDPCIDIVLPKKPEIRKTSDDVLTAVEVDRLVAALADVGDKYQSMRTNGRYAALVSWARGWGRGGTRRSGCGSVTWTCCAGKSPSAGSWLTRTTRPRFSSAAARLTTGAPSRHPSR